MEYFCFYCLRFWKQNCHLREKQNIDVWAIKWKFLVIAISREIDKSTSVSGPSVKIHISWWCTLFNCPLTALQSSYLLYPCFGICHPSDIKCVIVAISTSSNASTYGPSTATCSSATWIRQPETQQLLWGRGRRTSTRETWTWWVWKWHNLFYKNIS